MTRSLFDGDGDFAFERAVAVAHLRACDPALGPLIDAVGPFAMRLKKPSSTFEALAEAIVYQQLTAKAAATIYGRVCARFPDGGGAPSAEQLVAAGDADLRATGLSRPKLLSLRDLAARAACAALPSLDDLRGMDDETIVEQLTQVRGIGRWTVQMFLMFCLGRPDVLPAEDYGIRKGFAVALRKRSLPTPRQVEKRGARWQPYRTVASWYLWRAVELPPT